MVTNFHRRRTIINEGTIYKASDLFKSLTESIDERDFLSSDQKIPHEYKLYDPHTPVNPTRDIKKLCERDLLKIGSAVNDEDVLTPEDLTITDEIPSTYCKIYTVYQYIDSDIKKDEFIDNISRIFWFIRPNINDNRVKFHSLMRTILSSENPEESIRTLSDRIKTTYYQEGSDEDTVESQDIKNSLTQLKGQKNLTSKEIENFLNVTKYKSYNLYEKSFEKGPFKRVNKIYNLKYREALEEKGFKHILEQTYKQIYGVKNIDFDLNVHYDKVIDNMSDKLLTAIHKLYRKGDAVKADLVALDSVKDISGNIIIPSGGYVEVKMRDYHLDSYLSEYFSIYKESNINPKYKSKEMVEIYNSIINSLYKKIKISSLPILEDITANFYGIFFGEQLHNEKMMPVFIPSEYIDIYWSNKGKVETNKQLRLSIRYRLNSESLNAYYYDRDKNILIPSNLDTRITDKKVFGESVNKQDELLIESRIDVVKTKFPKIPEEVINYFVDSDLSGNQKYLRWLCSMWSDDDVNESIIDWGAETAEEGLVAIITDFHNLLPYIKEKDIYRYKVSWDTIDYLYDVIDEAETLKSEKQREKALKGDREIIFENSSWLVVSPKTHEASCHYGSGTRWCVASKNNPSYWDKYIKNSTFFYVINKKLSQDDSDLYKVAYRIIGSKPKIEIWDAGDMEFFNTSTGKEYMESLPEIMKQRMLEYHKIKHPKKVVDKIDDVKIQSLYNLLGPESDIVYTDEEYFGLDVYTNDNDGEMFAYAIGTQDDVDSAVREKIETLDDEIIFNFMDTDGDSIVIIPGMDYELCDYLTEKHGRTSKEWEICLSEHGIPDCLLKINRVYNNSRELYSDLADFLYIDYEYLYYINGDNDHILSNDGSIVSEDDEGNEYLIFKIHW